MGFFCLFTMPRHYALLFVGLLALICTWQVVAQRDPPPRPQEMVGCPGIRCPPGTTSSPRAGHKPSSNGCGSGGISISGQFDMTTCCDKHDVCYDTCNSSKETCDTEFLQCLDEFCKDTTKVPRIIRDSCSQQATLYAVGAS